MGATAKKVKVVKRIERPDADGSFVTTPHSGGLVELLGGVQMGSVVLNKDEFQAIERLYGYDSKSEDHPLMAAGARRNALREAEADGLRLMAWLAKYVPVGSDPLKTLVTMAGDAGLDVDAEDLEWADEV